MKRRMEMMKADRRGEGKQMERQNNNKGIERIKGRDLKRNRRKTNFRKRREVESVLPVWRL